MNVLITGVTGFVGSHLARYLLAEHSHVKVYGMKRWRSPMDNVKDIEGIHYVEGDLKDSYSLARVMDVADPDRIFHLGAQSNVPPSFSAPMDTMDTNANGTIRLLEAVRAYNTNIIVHVCSSSEVYGTVEKDDLPIDEDTPLRPASPYAVSKAAADLAARVYYEAYGLKTIRSRMFTHSGPGRAPVFVDSSFCRQLAKIKAGKQQPFVKHGNLDSLRTFCDVRDVVRAYWLLTEMGKAGEVYNIGGNETMTIGQMLNRAITLSGLEGKVQQMLDPTLLRPNDVTLQIPDVTKFEEQTMWTPEISYNVTLADMLKYWEGRVENPDPMWG